MGVKVYIAPVGDVAALTVWPAARQAQLEETKNARHRRSRYAVWRLLEYALRDALGLELRQLQLSLTDGKWTCPECFFSLAHSENAVAVAVSTQPVGVDIEAIRPLRLELAEKILSDEEMDIFRQLSPLAQQVYLLNQWCKKESIFKWGQEAVYRPKILIPGEMSRTGVVRLEGQPYTVAVTSQDPEPPRFRTVETGVLNAECKMQNEVQIPS